MKWTTRLNGDVLVFDLKGGLQGGPDALQIKDLLRDQLAEGHRKFILNLEQVDFVNSTGLGLIAAAYSAISAAGGKMKLAHANDKVFRVMTVTKLLSVFEAYSTEEEALLSFQSR